VFSTVNNKIEKLEDSKSKETSNKGKEVLVGTENTSSTNPNSSNKKVMTIPIKTAKEAIDPKKVANINKLSPRNMIMNIKDLKDVGKTTTTTNPTTSPRGIIKIPSKAETKTTKEAEVAKIPITKITETKTTKEAEVAKIPITKITGLKSPTTSSKQILKTDSNVKSSTNTGIFKTDKK